MAMTDPTPPLAFGSTLQTPPAGESSDVVIRVRNLWHFYDAPDQWKPVTDSRGRADVEATLTRVEKGRRIAAAGGKAKSDGRHVLYVEELDIPVGKFAAIVGPSGCGKSTLLTILGLLREATYAYEFVLRIGEKEVVIWQDGRRRSDVTLEALRVQHIGFALQSGLLLGALDGLQNVQLQAYAAGRFERVDAAEQLLGEFLDDEDLASQADGTLSGGQRQRVLLARSIVHDPLLVMCDEPTASLDQDTAFRSLQAVLRLRKQRNPDTTILIILHDMFLLERVRGELDYRIQLHKPQKKREWFGALAPAASTAPAGPPDAAPAEISDFQLYLSDSVDTATTQNDGQTAPTISTSAVASGAADASFPMLIQAAARQQQTRWRLQRARFYATLAWKDLWSKWRMGLTLGLCLLALALPVLMLFGLRNGVVDRLKRDIRQSPSLSRIRITPVTSRVIDEERRDELLKAIPDISYVSFARSYTGKLRFRRAGDRGGAIPLTDAVRLDNTPAGQRVRKDFAVDEDRVGDQFDFFPVEDDDPLLEKLELGSLSRTTLQIAVYRAHAEKLLRYAKVNDNVPAATRVEDGYFEIGVSRDGRYFWTPLRVSRLIEGQPREDNQVGFIPPKLMAKLEEFRLGNPVIVADDFSPTPSAVTTRPAEFLLPGTTTRYGAVDPRFDGILLLSTRSPDQPLVPEGATDLIRSFGLTAQPIPLDDPRIDLHGYFDRGTIRGGNPRKPSIRSAGLVRPKDPKVRWIEFKGSDREEISYTLSSNVNEPVFAVWYNPPVSIRLGGRVYEGVGAPTKFAISQMDLYTSSRIATTQAAARAATQAEARAATRPATTTPTTMPASAGAGTTLPSVGQLPRTLANLPKEVQALLPFVALVPLDSADPPLPDVAETVELTVVDPDGRSSAYPMHVLAVTPSGPPATPPAVGRIELSDEFVALHRACREGTARFDRGQKQFHPLKTGATGYSAAFVYPKDVDQIGSVCRQLKQLEYDVKTPGEFAVQEMQKNADQLDRLTKTVFTFVCLATIVTLLLLTSLNQQQEKQMVGLLKLVGVSSFAVLGINLLKNLLLFVTIAIVIVIVGQGSQSALRAWHHDAQICVLTRWDYLQTVAMAAASFAFALVISSALTLRVRPLSLIDRKV